MAQSVRDLPEEIRTKIEIREWDMHRAESREHFRRNKVRKLPSIAIAGKLEYEALIPDHEELVEKIKRAV